MKRVLTCLVACLLMAGCSTDAESRGSTTTEVDSKDTVSLGSTVVSSSLPMSSITAINGASESHILTPDETFIQSEIALYGDSYTPKYEAKFGPYTPGKEAEIRAQVPVEYTQNEVSSYFFNKYINIFDNRGLPNPSFPEIDDWIHEYDRDLVKAVGPGPNLAFDLTVIEKLEEGIDFEGYTLFKARVNRAYNTDVKVGNEVIIKQQGNEKIGVQTLNGAVHLQLVPGQRITALFYEPYQIDTKNGQNTWVYRTYCPFILYHETINNVEYVLDTMDQAVVEAAYFFQKADSPGDAYKVSKGVKDTDQELFVGILKAEVLDEVLKELL